MRSTRGRERSAHARAQLMAPIAALVERAKADGGLRPDFEAADIAMVHTMLSAVVRETQAVSPDLWRRYFAFIIDGLVNERSSPSDALSWSR